MLDSLDVMKRLDTRDVLGMIAAIPDHLEEGLRLGRATEAKEAGFDDIAICAMGGSAIGGDLVSHWVSETTDIPCRVVRSYHLPASVGRSTLVIAVSYSGNTEETLSMVDEAVSRGSDVTTVSSGGRIREIAAEAAVPHCEISPNLLPRATIGYIVGAIAGILESRAALDADSEVLDSAAVLRNVAADCCPEVETSANPAKKLAHELHGTVPVVVGYGLSSPIAKRWANQFNENAKMIAFGSELPEMNHNGIVGWMGDGRSSGFSMVFLDHDLADERMNRRVEATKAMVSERVRVFSSHSTGTSLLGRMFSLVAVGDYASVYSAFLRKEDPSTTVPIETLKRVLSKKGGGA
jgi:glucose/mannose-6-phosphate isomerase